MYFKSLWNGLTREVLKDLGIQAEGAALDCYKLSLMEDSSWSSDLKTDRNEAGKE